MKQIFANNAASYSISGIPHDATSITVAYGQGAEFPALNQNEYFVLTLESPKCGGREIVWVTSHDGVSDTLNGVIRGKEGTISRDFPPSTAVELRITAESLQGHEDHLEALQAQADDLEGDTTNAIANLALTDHFQQIEIEELQQGQHENDSELLGHSESLDELFFLDGVQKEQIEALRQSHLDHVAKFEITVEQIEHDTTDAIANLALTDHFQQREIEALQSAIKSERELSEAENNNVIGLIAKLQIQQNSQNKVIERLIREIASNDVDISQLQVDLDALAHETTDAVANLALSIGKHLEKEI